jgi:hypothetical protein
VTDERCPKCNSYRRDTFNVSCKSWAHDDWHEPHWRYSGPSAHEAVPCDPDPWTCSEAEARMAAAAAIEERNDLRAEVVKLRFENRMPRRSAEAGREPWRPRAVPS